ncbi:helix-turn-helix domain-containing protein [Halosimplex marinum]|uniref:helix-turn-helix domain-containing protein n=1 Tax=Halosimplex marinum TaxID=3396620 RepID=UPI003F55FFB3
MRYLRVAVHQEPAVRHPMHQFVVEREGYSVSRLLQYNTALDEDPAFLFHVDGDPDPYEPALRGTESVSAYEISRCPDDTFYLYVRESIPEHSRDFVGALTQPGLVGVMPIEYRADGTVRLTAVGPAEKLQTAVEEMPEGMDAEVLEVGEYDARRLDAGGDLTDRQFEAVVAAVDCGYYETPREGSVEDVGDRLDCAPGTAAELLRRAERSVMRNVVSTGPF